MKKIIIGVCAISAASNTFAASPFSLEATIGSANQEIFEGLDGDQQEVDSSTFAVKGAYEFTENWFAEVAYENYGEGSKTYINSFSNKYDETVESSAITIGLKKAIGLTDKLSVYGRIGASMWDVDYSIFSHNSDKTYLYSESGTSAYWGIGLDFNLTDNLYVTTSYTATVVRLNPPDEIDSTDNNRLWTVEEWAGENNIRNLAVGIGYKF